VKSERQTSWEVYITNIGWNRAWLEPLKVSAEDSSAKKKRCAGIHRGAYSVGLLGAKTEIPDVLDKVPCARRPALPPDAPTAFFSYSRDDLDFALRLAEDLKKAGANVWMDKLDIHPGQIWERKVEDALSASGRMLVIMSPSSVNSPNVVAEVAFALDEQKEVIPVLHRECKIPFRLRPFQYVDFRSDYSQGLEELLNTVGVEQQAAAGAAAASAAPVESQPVVPDAAEQARLEEERRRAAAERALLEQHERERREQERNGAPVPSPATLSPTLKRIALAACGILVAGLIVYWATRPKPQGVVTQKLEFQTQPSSHPPSAETSSGSAVAEKPNAEKAASDKVAADKAAAAVKQPTTESLTAESMFDKGNDYYFGRGVSQGYKQAFSWFRKATEEGNTGAMANLGVMYEHGYGVDKDYHQALTWNRKAVAAGNASGMNNLGFMYRYGLGLDKDYPQAVSWFRKAAEAGSAFGMDNLAEMYENGWGEEKDQRQAIAWYRKAAELGDQHAKDALKRLGESPQ
jgi:hypothetical protein